MASTRNSFVWYRYRYVCSILSPCLWPELPPLIENDQGCHASEVKQRIFLFYLRLKSFFDQSCHPVRVPTVPGMQMLTMTSWRLRQRLLWLLANSEILSAALYLSPSLPPALSSIVPLVLCSTSSSSFLNCCGFLCKWHLLLLFLSSLPLFQLNNTIVLTVAVMVVVVFVVVATVVAHMCSMSCKPKGKQLSGQVVIFVIGTFSLVIDSDSRVANYLCTQRKLIKFCDTPLHSPPPSASVFPSASLCSSLLPLPLLRWSSNACFLLLYIYELLPATGTADMATWPFLYSTSPLPPLATPLLRLKWLLTTFGDELRIFCCLCCCLKFLCAYLLFVCCYTLYRLLQASMHAELCIVDSVSVCRACPA